MKFQNEIIFFSVPINSLFLFIFICILIKNKKKRINGNREKNYFILKFHIFLQENLIINVEVTIQVVWAEILKILLKKRK